MYQHLKQIEKVVYVSRDMSEEIRLNILADISSLTGQIAKPTPNYRIVREAWDSIEKVVSECGYSDVLSKASDLFNAKLADISNMEN